MEPTKYIAVIFYEMNLGDHGEIQTRMYEIREGESIEALMARMPPRLYTEIRELE